MFTNEIFMMKTLLIVISLILSSCATQAQLVGNQKVSLLKFANEQIEECVKSMMKDEDYKYVSKNIRTIDNTAPHRYDLLKKESYLTTKDKDFFMSVRSKHYSCRVAYRDNMAKVDPRLGLLVSNFNLDYEILGDELMLDKINIAQFNQKADVISNGFERGYAATLAQLDSELRNAHTQELNYRAQKFEQDFSESYKREVEYQRLRELQYEKSLQSNQPAVKSPTQTNCYKNGNYVNCTTY